VLNYTTVSLGSFNDRRALVVYAGNELLNMLDAATGKSRFWVDPGTQNVITTIDPENGAKTINPDAIPNAERPCVICPSAFGAQSWPPTSFTPQTRFVYIPITEWCIDMSTTG